MPLDMKVREEVIKKLEEYEGRVPHFYLDSVGRVTVGVGHLVANRNAVSSLVMYEVKNGVPSALATLESKQKEYDNILKQAKGYKASYYKKYTTLIVKDPDIDALRDKHIDSFYQELTNIYKMSNGYTADFDKFPAKVQMALFDMIFNLGATKLTTQFVNFNASIKAGKWGDAAKHSNRPQVSSVRNLYVKSLLEAAENEKKPSSRFYLLMAMVVTFAIASCTGDIDAPKPFFNAAAFPGLVSVSDAPPYDAELDYELDSADGKVINIKNCRAVGGLRDADVSPSQYPLYKMLLVNCKAHSLFVSSRSASKTYLPSNLSMEFVKSLPADAVPRVSDEEVKRRVGQNLAQYEKILDIVGLKDNEIEIQTATDIIIYNVMARADFDNDGIEDILIRADFHSIDGFGQGSDLFIITKTSVSAPIKLVWRL